MYIKTSDQEKFTFGVGDYKVNWGLHIAGLYETEKERDKIIFGFLKQGLIDEDVLLYCPSERSKEEFHHSFSNYCPECAESDSYKENLTMFSPKDLYYPDGSFSPEAMDAGLETFYYNSQKDGARNVRASAEMVWALHSIPGIENLMVYESRLNYFIPGKPWVSVCLYNINKFDGATIFKVLQTHPFTISKGIITQNPLFLNPNDWLKENAPNYLKTHEGL